MAEYETYTNKFFSTDFMKGMMPANSLFPFDLGAMMETQRKNIEALSEMQQLTVERMQEATRMQSEILARMVQDNTSMAQKIMAEGTPEEKVALQTELMRKTYENSVSGMTELTDMLARSGKDAGEILSRRVTASLTEFKSSIEKGRKSTASAKAA